MTSKGKPSCSRIARRCGDVDARRIGGTGVASATFPGHPDLLAWPATGPLGRDERVVAGILCVGRSLKLDQPLNVEAVRPEQVDPDAVREVELDAAALLDRPVEPVHPKLRPEQALLRDADVGHA